MHSKFLTLLILTFRSLGFLKDFLTSHVLAKPLRPLATDKINSISKLNVNDTDACVLNAVAIMFKIFEIVQITTPVQWLSIVSKSQPQVKEPVGRLYLKKNLKSKIRFL